MANKIVFSKQHIAILLVGLFCSFTSFSQKENISKKIKGQWNLVYTETNGIKTTFEENNRRNLVGWFLSGIMLEGKKTFHGVVYRENKTFAKNLGQKGKFKLNLEEKTIKLSSTGFGDYFKASSETFKFDFINNQLILSSNRITYCFTKAD